MELRLDRLLADLRQQPESILAAIDADPMLLKRTNGELILANASKALYTPTAQHQLYAKGIVYRRDPYRLVSLPLIKIYNAGERNVTVEQLTTLAMEPDVRLRFLRKLDGSLIQVFRDGGKVWFTTRGMIEGARWRFDETEEDGTPEFDYIGEARRLALMQMPQLFDDPALLNGRTLIFEFIHPKAAKITNYGDRADLTLLACLDHARLAYLAHDALREVGERYQLPIVDALSPSGATLGEQMESLLASLAGTDEEGSVLCFEAPGEIVYRVKVKSPEYLRLMRLMAFCTYDRTLEYIDANPQVKEWSDLETVLQTQGSDRVPEEVLVYYRQHWDRYQAYLADLAKLSAWAIAACDAIDAKIGGTAGKTPGEYRRAFAEHAKAMAHSALVFAALDDRVDLARMRKMIRNEADAREACARLGL